VVRLIASLLGLLLIPKALASQGDRWDQQVNKALERSATTLKDRGYQRLGLPVFGLLFVDESGKFEFPVSGSAELMVVGACDDDCNDLQLVITNGTGYEIDAARGPGNTPVVRVSPPMLSGRYRVTVTMAGCKMSPCRYGVAAFSRRSKPAS
jgi:hypothetical protein